MNQDTVVLITGASSGVGQATAGLLAQQGYRVFGTSRRAGQVSAPAGVAMVSLDVRDDASVRACVDQVGAAAGRIDVLINNAGYELAGAIEDVSVAEAREQFETNVFGVHRMVHAVLPAMRARRAGRIVNVSSLAGLISIPFLGMYSATKFALEGYTEALRMEVHSHGIHVSLVEPAFLNTTMQTNRQYAAASGEGYQRSRDAAYAAFRREEAQGPGADLVARAILALVRSRNPRLRTLVGSKARQNLALRRTLPAAMFEPATRRYFGVE
jgi:NAD(P)-dependent dehydrogenase (short-subunit alcohol dehydrogenase family)